MSLPASTGFTIGLGEEHGWVVSMVQAERILYFLDNMANEGKGSNSVLAFPSTRRMRPALAFVGPSASSRRILSGAGGRQEFAPESATRGRVGLDSTRVVAVLKVRVISVGSLPGRLLFGCEGV